MSPASRRSRPAVLCGMNETATEEASCSCTTHSPPTSITPDRASR
jgi:hypothetical protein